MLKVADEKLLARILALGAGFTTILVVSGGVTDPVNATKLTSLGVTAFAAFGLISTKLVFSLFKENKILSISVIAFLLAGVSSVLSSSSPFSQGIYGAYGRNNGLLAYLFLVLILLSATVLKTKESFQIVIKGLIIAGVLNIAYCFWVIVFGDFVGWSNPYSNILGTFGNPNFIGSFLGIFIAAYLGYCLMPSASRWTRYSLLLVIPITAFEIYESHAIQGRIVGALGLGMVAFFYIRSRFSNLFANLYAVIGAAVGVAALLGAFQIGPLTSYIYKNSVSLRGQYWLAGWNAGNNNSVTGVGMDAFGDWYRRSRDVHALELPGVNVVVNAAHNVPLDMFAFGGWPLFISYLSIMILGGWALLRIILRTKSFDPILVVLTTSWVGYQLQSIISINQIGLAVWGWLLTGTAIAYEKITRVIPNNSERMISRHDKKPISLGGDATRILLSATFAFIGLVIALPPLTADAKWRSAQLARTVQAIEGTMEPSYFNPQNSTKYLVNIQTLEESQLFDLAHQYALQATNWNSESFDLWKVLYLIRDSTVEEKALALENMKRLDPLNPDVTTIQ